MKAAQEGIGKIEKEGYYILKNQYGSSDIQKLLDLTIDWHKKTVDRQSASPSYLIGNAPNVFNLQNKDPIFLKALFASEKLEVILKHFLNDKWFKQIPSDQPNYILQSFGARSSTNAMPLHIDSYIPFISEYVIGIPCAIILEDQNSKNGCTIVVPGSHHSNEYVKQSMLKKATPIESKAGDIVMWDSRLWHGTTENVSGSTRWSILMTFVRWWIKQYHDVTGNLPQDMYDILSDKEKAVLGFCSSPHTDEFAGTDLKRGYDKLLKNLYS
ncbi:MAG: hypothetical protein COB85_04810 [Bacteroidetes bacterium]|nr:MAG: hypothetical protein COB85_04810 [Bacteroidota bacterium]